MSLSHAARCLLTQTTIDLFSQTQPIIHQLECHVHGIDQKLTRLSAYHFSKYCRFDHSDEPLLTPIYSDDTLQFLQDQKDRNRIASIRFIFDSLNICNETQATFNRSLSTLDLLNEALFSLESQSFHVDRQFPSIVPISPIIDQIMHDIEHHSKEIPPEDMNILHILNLQLRHHVSALDRTFQNQIGKVRTVEEHINDMSHRIYSRFE